MWSWCCTRKLISGNIDVGGSKYGDSGLIASGSEHPLMGRKVHKTFSFNQTFV